MRGRLFIAVCTLMVCAGCFEQSIGEGRYVEAISSGRYQTFVDQSQIENIHLMRLNLVQFDTDAGGVLEIFRVADFATFENAPNVVTDSSPQYFCTRIEAATVNGNSLRLEYRDWLQRRWRIAAEIVAEDETVSGKIERIAADGSVVTERSQQLPEDALYLSSGGSSQSQLVFDQDTQTVTEEMLTCVDFAFDQEIVVELPATPPAGARIGVILTRVDLDTTAQNPLLDLRAREFLTATTSAIDVFENERSISIRTPPTLTVDAELGMAVAGVVVYIDAAEGTPDRWDTLLDGGTNERIWAYAPTDVLVFAETDLEDTTARDVDGVRLDTPLSSRAIPPQTWRAVRAQGVKAATGTNKSFRAIETFDGSPRARISLRSMPPECQLCYGSEAEEGCETCPSLLPGVVY